MSCPADERGLEPTPEERIPGRAVPAPAVTESMESKPVRPECEVTQRQMAGAVAHEIRNVLAGSKLVLTRALGGCEGAPRMSMTMEAANELGELYESISASLGDEDLARIHKIFNTLEFLDSSLGLVLKAVGRALSITTNVMESSRLEQGGCASARVILSDVVNDVINDLRQELCERNISVVLDIDESIRLQGDEMQCHSIIQNLVSNARDALLGRVDAGADGLIEIRARARDGRCVLEVKDNGAGIRQDDAGKIFEAFYSTKPTGTGLGLAITRKMVDAMGGDIRVQSEWGRGSQFTVTIPLPQ